MIIRIILLLFLQIVIGWFLLVSLYLTSSGEQEYRVTIPESVDCSSHSSCYFTNMSNTREVYKTSTLCTPHTFSACQKDCPEATCQFVRNVANKNYFWLQMVNIFGLYWGIFFFSAFSEMVLAGVFSKVCSAVFTDIYLLCLQWYWTYDKRSGLPKSSLGIMMWNVTFFHLGTLAFGSLVLAVVRMIRVILEYVERKVKYFNDDCARFVKFL